MVDIVVEDTSNELKIKTGKDDEYEHLIVPMVEIVVENVKLQSVWIPVLRTLATLVKAIKLKQSGENMRICLFVIGHS